METENKCQWISHLVFHEQVQDSTLKKTTYSFYTGFHVTYLNSQSSLICFNQNFTNQQVENKTVNQYFRIDEIAREEEEYIAHTIYDKQDGPRFRITAFADISNMNQYYFYGGIIAISKDTNFYLNDLWCFDYQEKSFRSISYTYRDRGDSPGYRGGHTFTLDTLTMKCYLFGGKNESDRLNDVYEFDIAKSSMKKISSITNPPIARNNHTAVIFKRSLIIFGGWDGTKTLNDMYELSLNTFIWYQILYKSDLLPPTVYRHTACLIGDHLLIFGGVNEFNEKFNEITLLNMDDKKWRILVPSGEYPSPRTFHSMVYCKNELLIIGGYAKSLLNGIYSIQLNDSDFLVEKSNEANAESTPENADLHLGESTCQLLDQIELLQRQVKELKSKYESELSKSSCKICFEKEINTVILDCCHRVICYECSLKCGEKCPACKGAIKTLLKTYN